ncbi:ABC transporter permease [uncultured Methylobacterium sp.]|uniref:ABC transporter permease n=1 Tax=uncultured Methylobacterium sp. TaxID=157278 RepID=UPI0035CAC44F
MTTSTDAARPAPGPAGETSAAGRIGGLALAAAFLAALYGLPLLRVAKNRLVVGEPVFAVGGFGPEIEAVAALAVGAAVLARTGRSRVAAVAATVLLALALGLLVLGLGSAADDLIAGEPPAARAGLASGAWTGLLLLGGGLALLARRTGVPGLGAALACGFVLFVAATGQAGALGGLSLAVEFAARGDAVGEALVRHLLLSGGAVLLAAAGAVLLSLWRRGQGLAEILVGGIQVVPAVALFGALVATTSGLLRAVPALREAGLGALGPVPALVGIAAYLLLPLWRGLALALKAPDPATLDAAEAIGLTPRRILFDVRLPIGAGILIGALRVACVQGIGLATLGPLVGAGGLGGIVFDGMAQFAPDLILLGAIPVVVLSLAVERGLSFAEDRVRQGRA